MPYRLSTFFLGLAAIFPAAVSPAAGAEAPARVLLLGEDVTAAYADAVAERLAGEADVTTLHVPDGPPPDWGSWVAEHVADTGWDVIHFAYGRALMRHVDPDGEPVDDPAAGAPRVDRGRVYGSINELIAALQTTDAFLIGATPTPGRGSVPGFDGAVDWEYGSVVRQMLGPNGVKINDMGDYTRTRLNEMVRPDGFLPTELGVQLMAEQVAGSVLEALNEGVDPSRPRVLLVGDSIVGGYYGATRDRLAGRAVVYSGGTTYNDADPDWAAIVDGYIAKGGERGWDVIQFNWGLHAVKWVDAENGNSEHGRPGTRVQFSPEAYLSELERFVDELERTGATLVFATTTPIPAGSTGSIVPTDLEAYNVPACDLMRRHGVVVNDLYGFAAPRLSELQMKDNVHFHAAGSDALAEQNVAVIGPLLAAARGAAAESKPSEAHPE